MIKKAKLIFSLMITFWCVTQEALGQLRIHESGRYLVSSNDKPFFWLGDTAWELFHRLSEEEARRYLKHRASLGFNVIQAVALAELDGLTDPNVNGDLPFLNQDITKPNEAYFRHVDAIIDIADSLGMFVGLLPTWGDKFNLKWGVGPVIFNQKNAFQYGQFMGARYRSKPIIWILGGDRNPETSEQKTIVEAMAKGIRSKVGESQLITYHPQGGYMSTDFFLDADWLDLNLFQSGHWAKDFPNYQFTERGYSLKPSMPVIDAEPCYEDHPINWKPDSGWYTDFDTRRAGYWSVLSGAAGHTFGNHNIWQMWQPEKTPVSMARTPWYEAVHYPGAIQAGLMRQIFEELEWYNLIPNQHILLRSDTAKGHMCRVATAKKKVIVYTPYGDTFALNLSKWDKSLVAVWIDPRTGNRIPAGSITSGEEVLFDPPFDPQEGNDWLLFLSVR